MMSATEKGKEIRAYFLECERELKEREKEAFLKASQRGGMTQIQILAQVANALADQEQTVLAHGKEIAVLHSKVDALEKQNEIIERQYPLLPSPKGKPPATSLRMQINTLVRGYCYTTKADHSQMWRTLYREFRNKYHIDFYIIGVNHGKKGVDIAEEMGLLQDLYDLAFELFRIDE
jgi:hypothetical protein